jgi:HAMP domain-containing protein
MSGDRIIVVDADGIAVADSKNEIIGKPVDRRLPPPVATLLTSDGPVGELYILPNRGPNDPDRAFVSAVNRSVLLGALVAGLAAVLFTLAISSRILKPVERLTEAARQMEKGDLSVRSGHRLGETRSDSWPRVQLVAGSLAQQEALRETW